MNEIWIHDHQDLNPQATDKPDSPSNGTHHKDKMATTGTATDYGDTLYSVFCIYSINHSYTQDGLLHI